NAALEVFASRLAHDVTSGTALAFVTACTTACRKLSTASRSLVLWILPANCATDLVVSRLSSPIARSKSRKAKSVGGGVGAVGGTGGRRPFDDCLALGVLGGGRLGHADRRPAGPYSIHAPERSGALMKYFSVGKHRSYFAPGPGGLI